MEEIMDSVEKAYKVHGKNRTYNNSSQANENTQITNKNVNKMYIYIFVYSDAI